MDYELFEKKITVLVAKDETSGAVLAYDSLVKGPVTIGLLANSSVTSRTGDGTTSGSKRTENRPCWHFSKPSRKRDRGPRFNGTRPPTIRNRTAEPKKRSKT